MRQYQLARVGNLLFTRVAVRGPQGTKVLRLLVDTGSSYTVIAGEVLEVVGCSPATSSERVRLVMGNGTAIVPLVQVAQIEALGKRKKRWRVAAHTLPTGLPFDGLLGMDFLTTIRAKIDLSTGFIEVS